MTGVDSGHRFSNALSEPSAWTRVAVNQAEALEVDYVFEPDTGCSAILFRAYRYSLPAIPTFSYRTSCCYRSWYLCLELEYSFTQMLH